VDELISREALVHGLGRVAAGERDAHGAGLAAGKLTYELSGALGKR